MWPQIAMAVLSQGQEQKQETPQVVSSGRGSMSVPSQRNSNENDILMKILNAWATKQNKKKELDALLNSNISQYTKLSY